MKKNLITVLSISTLVLLFAACTKDNSSIGDTEKKLPAISVSNYGLVNQVSPFNASDVILVNFAASVTGTTTGEFDIAWLDASNKTVDSTHFGSWNADSTKTTGHKIVAKSLPTTYPNTTVYEGNLYLKLSKLPTGNKSYGLKLYGRTSDGKVSTPTVVAKFITVN
ncbi:MAG: hypothetical protein J0I41_12650 [Filimonas sp.]|nr:hypothetical protein [Filimonas sp.]